MDLTTSNENDAHGSGLVDVINSKNSHLEYDNECNF